MSAEKASPRYDVQVLPATPGTIQSLQGNEIVAYPTTIQQPVSLPGGAAPAFAPGYGAGPSLLMMPQPSVIVVTVEPKKESEKKSEKPSEVFTRL